MVLDAKYKRYSEGGVSGIGREDLAQVISYMFIKELPCGGFLVPGGEKAHVESETLNGYGGKMYLLNMPIPQKTETYGEFCQQMSDIEKEFSINVLEIDNSINQKYERL